VLACSQHSEGFRLKAFAKHQIVWFSTLENRFVTGTNFTWILSWKISLGSILACLIFCLKRHTFHIHIRITSLREPRLTAPFFVTRIEPIPLLQIELISAIEKCPVKKRD